MRALLSAVLLPMVLLISSSSAHAQDADQVEAVSATTQNECDMARILVTAHTTPDDRNVWPILYVADDDARAPLDCTANFSAAGIAAYVEPPPYGQLATSVKGSIVFSRPVFNPDGTATMAEDVFIAPYFKSLTVYTLALKDGTWVITGRLLRLIT